MKKIEINKKHKRAKVKDNLNYLNIQFLNNLAKDSFADIYLDNTFVVFKSINDIISLIYSNKNKSIISYNLTSNKIINEIKNAHNNYITNFRHYLDNNNKRDLILSISYIDNNIKLWNINYYECLINIKNINKSGYLFSACFLNDNNQINIITSNGHLFNILEFESIKIYNLKGNKLKEIKNSNDNTYFIDSYYDNKYSKNYIIAGNIDYVNSFDYEKNKIYHKYNDKNNFAPHFSIVINNKKEIVELIESCYDGNIRIWNFHSGELLNKIKINNNLLFCICLWNNEYLFVGCEDNTIKLIDLNKGIIKQFKGHKDYVLTIKKIIHPKYGECLISQGLEKDGIKLWINKK